MRLFRQPTMGDWDAVIASFTTELAESAESRPMACPEANVTPVS